MVVITHYEYVNAMGCITKVFAVGTSQSPEQL